MTSDIFQLRELIDSLAAAYPHDEKAAELRRSFSEWWNHERPALPPLSGTWKVDVDAFWSAYIAAFARLFRGTPQTRSQALAAVVHAGMHVGCTTSPARPSALFVAAKSFLNLIANPNDPKG
jgi:hypothetical protein